MNINVLANDSDPEGDLVAGSLTIVSPPSMGTAIVTGGGVRFTAPFSIGSTSLQYQVCDAGGRCSTASIAVTIQPGSLRARRDSATITAGVDSIISPLANDRGDMANATLTIEDQSGGITITVNADGTLTVRASNGQGGRNKDIEYSVCVPGGGCDQTDIRLTVL